MQYSISHIPASRFALAIVATAATLLVFAAVAKGESTAVVAVPAGSAGESPAVEETTASVEPAPLPPPAEPVDAPEPGKVTEAVTEAGNSVTEAVTEAGDIEETASGAVESAQSTTPPQAELGVDAVTSSVHRVSKLAGQISQNAPDATASVTGSAKTVAQAVNPVMPIDQVQNLGREVLGRAGDALHRGPLGLAAPGPAENSRPSAGAPAGADAGAFSQRAAPMLPGTPPIAHPQVQVTILESPASRFPAGLGNLETLQLEVANAAGSQAARAPFQMATDAVWVSPGDAGRAQDLASPPSDGRSPTPSPDLPPVAASGGDGSSSFVPTVALLALLALVVPTVLRRLREVPDFPAPTSFVCALERPG